MNKFDYVFLCFETEFQLFYFNSKEWEKVAACPWAESETLLKTWSDALKQKRLAIYVDTLEESIQGQAIPPLSWIERTRYIWRKKKALSQMFFPWKTPFFIHAQPGSTQWLYAVNVVFSAEKKPFFDALLTLKVASLFLSSATFFARSCVKMASSEKSVLVLYAHPTQGLRSVFVWKKQPIWLRWTPFSYPIDENRLQADIQKQRAYLEDTFPQANTEPISIQWAMQPAVEAMIPPLDAADIHLQVLAWLNSAECEGYSKQWSSLVKRSILVLGIMGFIGLSVGAWFWMPSAMLLKPLPPPSTPFVPVQSAQGQKKAIPWEEKARPLLGISALKNTLITFSHVFKHYPLLVLDDVEWKAEVDPEKSKLNAQLGVHFHQEGGTQEDARHLAAALSKAFALPLEVHTLAPKRHLPRFKLNIPLKKFSPEAAQPSEPSISPWLDSAAQREFKNQLKNWQSTSKMPRSANWSAPQFLKTTPWQRNTLHLTFEVASEEQWLETLDGFLNQKGIGIGWVDQCKVVPVMGAAGWPVLSIFCELTWLGKASK